jgi:hypothetical protein
MKNRQKASISIGVSILACAISLRSVADVQLQSTDVFVGGEDGYAAFRIPSISRSNDGTLIAVAEGRYSSTADPGGTHIDLVESRSTDGGLTWSPLTVLDRNPASSTNLSTDKTSACNPVSLSDPATGRIFVFDMRLPNGQGIAVTTTANVSNVQTWMRYSDNDGQTWSTAQQIAVPQYAGFYPNIGSGIQMVNGELVIPATDVKATSTGNTTYSFALYSNDQGATWQAGALLNVGTNEESIVQLANGNLLSNTRPNSGTNRILTTSTDGGATFGASTNGFVMTEVDAGILRYTQTGVNGATQNQILFSYPAGGFTARAQLSIASSFDEGQTYIDPRLAYVGYAAYSDMVRLGGDQAGVLWERGTNTAVTANAGYQEITYTSFNSQFLNPGTARGLIASDSFSYPGSTTIGEANGGNGWNSTWSQTSGLANASTATFVSAGLTRSGLGYTPTGGAAMLQGNSMARSLGVTLDLSTNTTYYLSTLVNRASTSGSGSQNLDIQLLDSTGAVQLAVGADAGGQQWYVNQFGTTTNTGNASIASLSTYLLVAKIVAEDNSTTGNYDELFLKVFAPGDTIPASDADLGWTLVGTTDVNSSVDLDRILIQGGANAQWTVEELRIGTTWASVAVPEPAIGSLAILMGSVFILRRSFRRGYCSKRCFDTGT